MKQIEYFIMKSALKGFPFFIRCLCCHSPVDVFVSFVEMLSRAFDSIAFIYMCICLHLFPCTVDWARGSFRLEMQMLVTGDRSKHSHYNLPWQRLWHERNMTTHKWIDTIRYGTMWNVTNSQSMQKVLLFAWTFLICCMLRMFDPSLYLLMIHCLVTCPPANGIDTDSTKHKRNRCTNP